MTKMIIILLFIPLAMNAQKSGLIVYDMTMKIELGDRINRIPKEMRDRIPKERKSVKELYFNDAISSYKEGEMEQPEDSQVEGGERGRRFRMRFMGGGGERETYKDITNNEVVDKNDLMGKAFLIKDEMPEYEWKITGNKKKVLSYLAMEATTMMDDTIAVTAWFTPQIPISNGPENFHGLPGMILEINQNDGQITLFAKEIQLGAITEDQIVIPKKGKEVTREEFDKIRIEKRQEMREQRGGRGAGFRIRRGGE